jgi:hypothetical protein
MRRKRITRRALIGSSLAGLAARPAIARVLRGGGAIPSGGGGILTTNSPGTRPYQQLAAGMREEYPLSWLIATISRNPSPHVNDHLIWWCAPLGYSAGTPIYLNGTTTPPVSGVVNASFDMPSIRATHWNTTWGAGRITPVAINWELRLISGVDNTTVKAAVPITIDTLKRSNPYFPMLNTYLFSGSAVFATSPLILSGQTGGTVAPVVAGVVTVGFKFAEFTITVPVANTFTVLYTIDDIPIGTQVTGPSMGGATEHWPLTFDTRTVAWNGGTGISDGTHALGCRVVESTSTPYPPYYFRQLQGSIIVNNSGGSVDSLYAGPTRIPLTDTQDGPNLRINSGVADFVTFPGLTAVAAGLHNTATPLPTPQSGVIPPACSSASPQYRLGGAGAPGLLDSNQFFNESFCGNLPTEYSGQQRFFTNPDVGGVYTVRYYPEQGQDIMGDYTLAYQALPLDGQRNDCMVHQNATLEEGTDGSGNSFWLGFEETGRIFRLDYSGQLATLAGLKTNRNVLGYPDGASIGYSTIPQSDYDTRVTRVGTIGSPSFRDLRGMNDGAYG